MALSLTRLSHLAMFPLLAIFTLRLRRNLLFLRRARGLARLPDRLPRVSVLVPARDEARTIAACIESLAGQEYPDFEVIALDDQSSDGTGALLDELAARHANVTVLHGTEHPPAGWNGKSHTCQRLAGQATGEWLLLTDADTHHAPASIARGIAQAEGLGADLLSAFPRQLAGSWSEWLVVSFILDFLPLVAVDLTSLWRSDSGRTVSNGQYMLVRASTYRALGGHTAISRALLEDFALAKHARSKGYRVALVDGTSMVSCRMYRGVREVWEGFSRSILPALEISPAEERWWQRLFLAWGFACVFVTPFGHLLCTNHKRQSLLAIGWLAVLRGVVNLHFARPLTEVVGTPLAAWIVMVFALGALLRRQLGRQVRWKGRDYTTTG